MKKAISILICILIAVSISAQTSINEQDNNNQPYIEVSGTSELEIVPDQIYISITIHERYINKIKITIEEQETKLKKSLDSLGIDLNNLSLSDANADFVRIRWKTNDVMTKKNYNLLVTDAVMVGKVFQTLDIIQIHDAEIGKVSHSKLDSLRKEVNMMAIKAAREKAAYLLAAIGEEIGQALIIKENQASVYINSNGMSQVNSKTTYGSDAYKSSNDEIIQFQKIKLTSSYYVKFAIKVK